jgi:hypothetical protein
MLVFLDRSGMRLRETDQDHIADTIERLAARDLSEREFVAWLQRRVA